VSKGELLKPFVELYIHIPFCVRKCNYCDFLSFPAAADAHKDYVTKLLKELIAVAPMCSGYSVSSVFIGGGTPSILSEAYISIIIETVGKYYDLSDDAEITIETNPGTTMRHKFASYKRAGINRISIGLQSADNAELKMLGRIHSFEEFLKSYESARMEGFDNINIDLMNCFPLQNTRTWKKTLRNVIMLKPEHVSIYNLIVEPGTPFYEMQKQGALRLPDENTQTEIDDFTKEHMHRMGYERYEISNWAKPGNECRHNLGYWTGVPYIGFGLGASSYFDNKRWKNTSSMKHYMELDIGGLLSSLPGEKSDKYFELINPFFLSLREEEHELSKEEQMSEFVYLGLRTTKGISETGFLLKFGQKIENVFGSQLDKYTSNGLLVHDNHRYYLSDRGLDISNVIMSEFV